MLPITSHSADCLPFFLGTLCVFIVRSDILPVRAAHSFRRDIKTNRALLFPYRLHFTLCVFHPLDDISIYLKGANYTNKQYAHHMNEERYEV